MLRTKSRSRTAMYVVVGLLASFWLGGNPAHADDWPQWRGPRRDAVSDETGLLSAWPADGPKIAWRAAGLGTGYSSVVVGHGLLFTMGRKESDVVVTALDAATGKIAWTRKIGETARNPCSTPTLDGDLLFALDPDGDLVCLKAATGDIVWQKNFIDDFAGRMMSGRGYGESPLIDGDRLIATPGGADAALVSLNKLNGDVVWKAKLPDIGSNGKDGAGFSSVVVTEAAGVRQYVQLVGRGVIGVNSRDGRYLWGYNAIANDTANIPTPIVDNEYVFAANGYTAGSVLLKLIPDGDRAVKAEMVYTLTGSQFQNHHGGVVRIGDYLFAGHGNNNGLPTCLEFRTGRVVWKRRGVGVGSAAVVAAEGQLYFRYQNGVVALIEASPRGYKLNGTLEIPGAGGDSWAHPVVANGKLFLREQDSLFVYDVQNKSKSAEPKTSTSGDSADSTAQAIRKQGVSIETLSRDSQRSKSEALKNWGDNDSAFLFDHSAAAEPIWLVTLNDSQLSTEGRFADDLIVQLKSLPGKLVINAAGTNIPDAALRQLRSLNVVGLNLELCRSVNDVSLQHVGQIQRLRSLILTGTNVTHVGLRHLVGHENLVSLDLELCDGIDDAACEPLGELKQLRFLVLKKSGFERKRISDAGLKSLQGLSQLESLNLYGNSVTDAGLAHLRSLTTLRSLNLSLLAITDSGLKHLAPLTNLEHLDLLYSEGFAGPMLTNESVTLLEPMMNLTSLNVTGAKLNDVGLSQLQSLTKLKRLQVARTRVTADGVQAFQKALPKCDVIQ